MGVSLSVVTRSADAASLVEFEGAWEPHRLAFAETLEEASAPLAEDGAEVLVEGAGVDAPPSVDAGAISGEEVKRLEMPLMLAFRKKSGGNGDGKWPGHEESVSMFGWPAQHVCYALEMGTHRVNVFSGLGVSRDFLGEKETEVVQSLNMRAADPARLFKVALPVCRFGCHGLQRWMYRLQQMDAQPLATSSSANICSFGAYGVRSFIGCRMLMDRLAQRTGHSMFCDRSLNNRDSALLLVLTKGPSTFGVSICSDQFETKTLQRWTHLILHSLAPVRLCGVNLYRHHLAVNVLNQGGGNCLSARQGGGKDSEAACRFANRAKERTRVRPPVRVTLPLFSVGWPTLSQQSLILLVGKVGIEAAARGSGSSERTDRRVFYGLPQRSGQQNLAMLKVR